MKGGRKEREDRQSIDVSRKSNKHMRDTSYDHRGRGQNLYPLKMVATHSLSALSQVERGEGVEQVYRGSLQVCSMRWEGGEGGGLQVYRRKA